MVLGFVKWLKGNMKTWTLYERKIHIKKKKKISDKKNVNIMDFWKKKEDWQKKEVGRKNK